MFIPISPAEAAADGRKVDAKYYAALESMPAPSKGQLKIRREKEVREAKKQVAATTENWAMMFRGDKGKAYFKVGEVKRPAGWPENTPVKPLCKDARLKRPIRMGP